MSTTIIHIPSGSKLTWFQPVLAHWFDLMDRYCQIAGRNLGSSMDAHPNEWNGYDCPWWYNERANVGMLAGAAHLAGFTALEEFNEEKSEKASNLDSWKGRVDLAVWPKKGKAFGFEAKFGWLHLDDLNSNENSTLEKLHKESTEGATDLMNDYAGLFGLGFAAICSKKEYANGRTIDLTDLSQQKRLQSAEAYAIYSPRIPEWTPPEWNDGKSRLHCHHGVLLAIWAPE